MAQSMERPTDHTQAEFGHPSNRHSGFARVAERQPRLVQAISSRSPVLENLRAFVEGRPLNFIIDEKRYELMT